MDWDNTSGPEHVAPHSFREKPRKLGQEAQPITIRARLLLGFLLLALLPALAITVGSTALGYVNGRQQTLDRLESVAALREIELDTWTQSLEAELAGFLAEEYTLERVRVVLVLAQKEKYIDYYDAAVRNRLTRVVEQSPLLEEAFFLDVQGGVALSTDVRQEGRSFGSAPFFQQGLVGPHVQLLFESDEGDTAAFVAIPVVDLDGERLGVMVGRAAMDELLAILDARGGLGRTGRTYLVGPNYIPLSGTNSMPADERLTVHSPAIDVAVSSRASGAGVYTNQLGMQVIGVYRWLPELQAALLAEQASSEALGAILAALGVNLGIALAAILLAVLASWFISHSIAAPLVNLASTAAQIAAGDLAQVARVTRNDEVGTVARAFNSMTAQLRDLINSLEQRVHERTQALRRRAVQLETSAQISREITSILEIDELLTRVVDLIRDVFGYYHVRIFLVNDDGSNLVLRVTSAQAEPRVRHVPLGPGSLNGEAAQANQALLVNDVSRDARYLADEDLPDTRAELVVPLRVGEEVVGTLDVQSREVDAFTPEDVLVIQSLGDQLAIAIENARLYRQARQVAVMEERQRLARDLHDSVTQALYSMTLLTEGGRRLAHAGVLENAEVFFADLWEISRQSLKEMRLMVHELRPPALEQEGLVGAVQARLDAVEGRAGVETRLLVDGECELPPQMEEALYRIALEALNNALKHAAATAITVRIDTGTDQVQLEVTDNGRGFDPHQVAGKGGIGLATMRERAERLGGRLEIETAPGAGTRIRVTLETAHGRSDTGSHR